MFYYEMAYSMQGEKPAKFKASDMIFTNDCVSLVCHKVILEPGLSTPIDCCAL